MTILKTSSAIVNGKQVVVEQIKGTANRQDISYKVNGKQYPSDKFWAMKPKFIKG